MSPLLCAMALCALAESACNSAGEGWTFRARVIEDDLDVVAEGQASVLVDDLLNTYQLLP